jgi:hypothetical protein
MPARHNSKLPATSEGQDRRETAGSVHAVSPSPCLRPADQQKRYLMPRAKLAHDQTQLDWLYSPVFLPLPGRNSRFIIAGTCSCNVIGRMRRTELAGGVGSSRAVTRCSGGGVRKGLPVVIAGTGFAAACAALRLLAEEFRPVLSRACRVCRRPGGSRSSALIRGARRNRSARGLGPPGGASRPHVRRHLCGCDTRLQPPRARVAAVRRLGLCGRLGRRSNSRYYPRQTMSRGIAA